MLQLLMLSAIVVLSATRPTLAAPEPATIPAKVFQHAPTLATNPTITSNKSASEAVRNTPIKDKWALVVGISKFQNPSLNLRYAAKDAQDFYSYLVHDGHFAPDHVKLLTNEQATLRSILSELGDRWLPRVANPDDLVVIYISSHGSSSDLDVDRDNFIVAYDTDVNDLYTTALDMQDFTRIIKHRVHSDRIAIILDACHSGATTPDAKGVFRLPYINAEQIAQGSGQLVISSSLPNQVSWEFQNQPNSVFTRYLLEGLRLKGPDTDIGDAFEYMKDKVQTQVLLERGVLQTPVLKSAWQGNNLKIAVQPGAPRPGLSELESGASAGASSPDATAASTGQAASTTHGIVAVTPQSPVPPSVPPASLTQPPATTVPLSSSTSAAAPSSAGTTVAVRPPAQSSSLPESQSSIPPHLVATAAVLVLPCRGPVNIQIDPVVGKDLWGTMNGPQDFENLSAIVTQKLIDRLREKLVDGVLDVQSISSQARSSLHLDDKTVVAREAGAQLVASITIDNATWAPGTMSNKYTLVTSANLYSGTTGGIIWQLKQHTLRKAPFAGDMKGGRAYFETTMASDLADYLASELYKAIKLFRSTNGAM